MDTLEPIHFIDEQVEVAFDTPPLFEKTPPCPNGFTWREEKFRILEVLSEWRDYSRKGRKARNMRPEHAIVAAGRGSRGVGRFYFRVRSVGNDGERVFDLYYDRAPKDSSDRLGAWVLYRELA